MTKLCTCRLYRQGEAFVKQYELLKKQGIKDLYLIRDNHAIGTDHEGSVDGTHPNDLGFDRMVEQYQPQIMRILKKYGSNGIKRKRLEFFEPFSFYEIAWRWQTYGRDNARLIPLTNQWFHDFVSSRGWGVSYPAVIGLTLFVHRQGQYKIDVNQSFRAGVIFNEFVQGNNRICRLDFGRPAVSIGREYGT